jgi:hypothetical protein
VVTAFDLDDSMIELLLFEEVPRRMLESWTFRTFTVHPEANRFDGEEFTAEMQRHGLHGTGTVERRLGGMLFFGAARKA